MDIEEESNKISNDKDNLELYELFTIFTVIEMRLKKLRIILLMRKIKILSTITRTLAQIMKLKIIITI